MANLYMYAIKIANIYFVFTNLKTAFFYEFKC